MSRVEAAAATDRLPWLPDEPKPSQAKRRNAFAPWAAGIVLAVAAGAFWLGVNSVQQPSSAPVARSGRATTVRLPQARPIQPDVRIVPQPEVQIAPAPQVHRAPEPEVRIAPAPAERKPAHVTVFEKTVGPASAGQTAVTPPTLAAPAVPEFVMPKPWNPRIVSGASGRLVQVGAFGSVHQAKRGWWFMIHDYPAMAHLPAVVRVTHNSRGRPFFRFDVGTTSQAHSEVLCQRMQKIHFSCAVVGLPWKAKVER